MQTYSVDDELAALVEHTAREKPFEQLSFNEALWRVMRRYVIGEHGEPAPEMRALGPLDGSPTLGHSVSLNPTRPQQRVDLESLLEDLRARQPKKAPTPSARQWASSIPELKDKNLSDWTEICEYLGLDPAGDSARRFMQRWVKANRPSWPPVPSP
jgi:hypothetical protein